MGRGGGRGRQATTAEQREALREEDTTVAEPIARDRLREGRVLRRGFASRHRCSPFHTDATQTSRGERREDVRPLEP